MADTNPFLVTGGIVLLFFIVFPLWWVFIVWLISRFGWNKLAERYGTEQIPYGDVRSMQAMRVGASRYNGTVTLTSNDNGVFIETMWLFRAGHKRLFIPWVEMHDPKPSAVRIWPVTRVTVGYPEVGTIALPEKIFTEGPRAAQRILEEQRSTTSQCVSRPGFSIWLPAATKSKNNHGVCRVPAADGRTTHRHKVACMRA